MGESIAKYQIGTEAEFEILFFWECGHLYGD